MMIRLIAVIAALALSTVAGQAGPCAEKVEKFPVNIDPDFIGPPAPVGCVCNAITGGTACVGNGSMNVYTYSCEGACDAGCTCKQDPAQGWLERIVRSTAICWKVGSPSPTGCANSSECTIAGWNDIYDDALRPCKCL